MPDAHFDTKIKKLRYVPYTMFDVLPEYFPSLILHEVAE
jgi:hypothetical protein